MAEQSDGGATAPRGSLPTRAVGLVRRLAGDLVAWLKRVFPADTTEPRTRSGYTTDSRRESWYWLVALAIAIGFAALWEWIVRVQPVPPGGDPSTWLITGYAFVGLQTTAGVQPLAYPPLAFPFVGLAVLLGQGP